MQSQSEREQKEKEPVRIISKLPSPLQPLLLTPDVTVQVPQQGIQLLGSSTTIVQLLL